MPAKRIERTTSRTAAMTCLSRAASFLEKNPYYHSNDYLSPKILPNLIRILIHVPLFRKGFVRLWAPAGIYEYVIARTKYIDRVLEKILREGVEQVLVFGAGYDSRALRFQGIGDQTRFFELDEPHTQQAKIKQFKKRHLSIPASLGFIPVDFEKESLIDKLDRAGFLKGRQSLFILEGLVMYLDPGSVQEILRIIQEYAGDGSWIVFDYVQASVLRHENRFYGEAGLVKMVSKAGEQWRFGIEPSDIDSFMASFGFKVIDHKCAQDLEDRYFKDEKRVLAGRVNGTHCLLTAKRK